MILSIYQSVENSARGQESPGQPRPSAAQPGFRLDSGYWPLASAAQTTARPDHEQSSPRRAQPNLSRIYDQSTALEDQTTARSTHCQTTRRPGQRKARAAKDQPTPRPAQHLASRALTTPDQGQHNGRLDQDWVSSGHAKPSPRKKSPRPAQPMISLVQRQSCPQKHQPMESAAQPKSSIPQAISGKSSTAHDELSSWPAQPSLSQAQLVTRPARGQARPVRPSPEHGLPSQTQAQAMDSPVHI
jgi:hypothetical protein